MVRESRNPREGRSGRGGEWESGRGGERKNFPPSPLHRLTPSSPPADPFLRGSEYLRVARQLAVQPGTIDVTDEIGDRIRIYTWIGQHIDAINAELQTCLEACHSCFHPQERRAMQILAAPLAEGVGVDGFCNILAEPIAIVIDVGRTYPRDWLSIVAHEYAHAYLGFPGHDRRFLAVLAHLCLGLGLDPPQVEGFDERDRETWLQNWPHCTARPDPLAFWRGQA